MVSFAASVIAGMSFGGAAVGWARLNRPWYGLFYGTIQGTIAIALDQLFGRKASALYLAGVVIYTVANFGRSAQVTASPRSNQQPTISCPANIKNQVAWGTYQAVQQKSYTNNDVYCNLSSGEELLKQTQSFSNTTGHIQNQKFKETEVQVVEKDILEAAQEATQAGGKMVAVIMAAHPLNPGSDMLESKQSQEADLCCRSDMFGLMWDQLSSDKVGTKLYPLVNIENPEQDKMFHTPDVTVFRASSKKGYAFLDEPFRVGMIASPPPYKRTLEEGVYRHPGDLAQLERVLTTQLSVASQLGYETVVIGAFGCDAHGNPPAIVANNYHKIIMQHFRGEFKKIIFAIVDDANKGPHNPEGNLKPFQDKFGTKPYILGV